MYWMSMPKSWDSQDFYWSFRPFWQSLEKAGKITFWLFPAKRIWNVRRSSLLRPSRRNHGPCAVSLSSFHCRDGHIVGLCFLANDVRKGRALGLKPHLWAEILMKNRHWNGKFWPKIDNFQTSKVTEPPLGASSPPFNGFLRTSLFLAKSLRQTGSIHVLLRKYELSTLKLTLAIHSGELWNMYEPVWHYLNQS